jgi:hypothetical protein
VSKIKNRPGTGAQPVISATQEAEMRRIEVQSQPSQIVLETLSQKHPSQKRAGGVAQVVDPEFKSQHPVCVSGRREIKNKQKKTAQEEPVSTVPAYISRVGRPGY